MQERIKDTSLKDRWRTILGYTQQKGKYCALYKKQKSKICTKSQQQKLYLRADL